MGTAIDGFDRTGFDVVEVNEDFGGVLRLAASDIISRSQNGRQGDGRADLVGFG